MGIATEKIFLAPIRIALQPEVRDLWMPAAGVAHNLALVEIEKSYEGQAFKTINALWGAGQMMFNKMMVVSERSVRDLSELAAGLRAAQIPLDVLRSRGPLDVLDHATGNRGEGGKIAIDLTTRREANELVVPSTPEMCDGIVAADFRLAEKWGALFLFADPLKEVSVVDFAAQNKISGVNFFVVMDAAAEGLRYEELLWLATGNCDPERDIAITGGALIVDARSKIGSKEGYPSKWPNVVTSLPETIALVDKRWGEYGIGETIESPSLRYIKLLHSGKAEV